MIPKIIHLCWLSGDPYPEKIAKCISTWEKYLPDYEIMLWDTERFDVNSTLWTKQAFETGKYAFVSDYIRFYAVYNFGGIYLDSDIEVLKSFDDLLDLPYFVGHEFPTNDFEIAVMGAEKGTEWVKKCLDYYTGRRFINSDGSLNITTCPRIMTPILKERFAIKDIFSIKEFNHDKDTLCVFPVEFFCGKRTVSKRSRISPAGRRKVSYHITDEAYSIHHCAHNWSDFPGGPLHKLFYRVTGMDWKKHYLWDWNLHSRKGK